MTSRRFPLARAYDSTYLILMNTTRTTKSFSLRIKHSANDLFGAVDYTLTETLTERDGGLQVDTVARGRDEDGSWINQKSSKFHAGASMESAAAYRLSHGYMAVR